MKPEPERIEAEYNRKQKIAKRSFLCVPTVKTPKKFAALLVIKTDMNLKAASDYVSFYIVIRFQFNACLELVLAICFTAFILAFVYKFLYYVLGIGGGSQKDLRHPPEVAY